VEISGFYSAATQILREINFKELKMLKSVISDNLVALEFDFGHYVKFHTIDFT